MALAYIDDTGLHLPDYPAVLDDVKAKIRAIFGDDLYLEPDSQEGQLVSVFALAVFDAYALAGSVYNAYSPQTAQGAGLSRMVVLNGIRRQTASRSTVVLRLVGEAGTVIRGGIAADGASRRWLLPDEVTIPNSGEIEVTATAEAMGDIRAGAGEIDKIATPCRGWQSVSNRLPAVAGAPVEKDAALRGRQIVSTALPSRTVFEGTLGAVANVPGVIRWRGYENDTSAPDEHGIPGHHICLVVEGGDNQAIAGAIATKKTPGAGTYGDISVTNRDKYGSPNTIRFYRPLPVRIKVALTIKPMAGYLSTTGLRIRQNLAEHISGLPIGDDVLASRLLTPINAADADGARTFDVVSLTLAAGDGAPQSGNVAIAFNAAAVCEVEDVDILEGGL